MSRQSVTAILPTVSRRTSVTLYDPEQGLKTIAVAEAGEKHWARAKDATQLLAAIETKIKAQAEYVVWRDGVPVTPHAGPGRGKKNHVAVLKRSLPEADPGDLTVHRWRKRLCTKNGAGTIDLKKLERVLEERGCCVVRNPASTEMTPFAALKVLRRSNAIAAEMSRPRAKCWQRSI